MTTFKSQSATKVTKKEFVSLKGENQSEISQIQNFSKKNISEKKQVWQIIKNAGCDKFSEGDASISEKHCNFFVNNGKAKSADIERLINRVKETVSKKMGVDLELEIKIIGE